MSRGRDPFDGIEIGDAGDQRAFTQTILDDGLLGGRGIDIGSAVHSAGRTGARSTKTPMRAAISAPLFSTTRAYRSRQPKSRRATVELRA